MKKNNWIGEGLKRGMVCFLVALLAALPMASQAELTARVYPGYVFSSTERPTTSTLNLLGTPTIVITGTLGGTNVALGAGTVSGTMLMDSVAGAGLDWNGNSPRGLMIAAGGVGVVNFASTNWGWTLTNTGGRIQVRFDDSTLGTNSNGQLAIKTDFLSGTTFSNAAATAAINSTFTSSEYTIPGSGVVANVAHNLGGVPVWIRWVLVCKTADDGYAVGDEVDALTAAATTDGDNAFTSGCNATNVFLIKNTNTDGSGVRIHNKSTGAETALTLANWRIKAYARRW